MLRAMPNYCKSSGLTSIAAVLRVLRAGSQELGGSAKQTQNCMKLQARAGWDRENGREVFQTTLLKRQPAHVYHHCLHSDAFWIGAVWLTNSPVLAALPGKFTQAQATSQPAFQAFPHFLCISLLSHVLQAASLKQQHSCPYHPLRNIVPRHRNLPGQPVLPWPGADGAHRAVSFRIGKLMARDIPGFCFLPPNAAWAACQAWAGCACSPASVHHVFAGHELEQGFSLSDRSSQKRDQLRTGKKKYRKESSAGPGATNLGMQHGLEEHS